MVALICSIIGGTDSDPGDSDINEGYTLRRVGSCLFVLAVIIILAVAFGLRRSSPTSQQKKDPQLNQLFVVLPIVLVRTVYSTAQNFISSPSNPGHNTYVYFVLLLLPDFISISIYTIYGLRILPASTEKIPADVELPYTTDKFAVQQPNRVNELELGQLPEPVAKVPFHYRRYE